MNKFTILLAMIATLVVVVLFMPSAGEESAVQIEREPRLLALSDVASTTRVQVVGVVDAADTAVVAAQTNGVLRSLSVVEGDMVASGQIVALQATPVADAEVAYRAAQRTLAGAEQAAAVDARQYTAEKAAVVARSAEEIALIQTEAAATQLQAETAAVRTATEVGVTTMLDALAFVNENSSLFDDTRRAEFRAIVSDLYGSIPNHFSPPVRYAADRDGADVTEMLVDIRTIDVAELSVIDVETLSVVVMGQLRALQNLYATAESDVLDRDVVGRSDTRYETYFTNRTNITSALATLEGAAQRLEQRIDGLAETTASTGQNVAVSELDVALAERQYTFSAEIAAAAEAVAQAATAMAVAEQSLGVVTAPFSGAVSSVVVNVGEYVAAGQPLFTLQGAGARELAVSVPVSLASNAQVGDAFYIDIVRAGVVDRVQVGETGHSVTVFISLFDTDMPVGTSVRGELVFAAPDDTVTIPRDYVFFGVAGSVVRSYVGADYVVDIVSDGGEVLTVRFDTDVPAFTQLVPNHGISF